MRISKKVLLSVLLIGIPFFISACLPNLDTTQSSKPKDEFIKGSIVKGFPGDIPLYKNAQVVESFGGKEGWGASFVVDEDLVKVFDFYNKSLPATGWESNVKKRSETNYAFEIKNETKRGEIIVNTAADGKKTSITISLADR